MLHTLFWLTLGLIAYTHVGYPLLLAVLSRLVPKPVRREAAEPSVSIIVAAHNEEAIIRQKLANTLELRYPPLKREIILVSDGSTDSTDAIAATLASQGVVCLRLPERSGKSTALNCGLAAASGDVLVFTDAAAMAEPDCLQMMMADFSDATVGCVSSEDAIDEPGGSSGEGSYVRYEMALRGLESRVGSCAAVSGSFYAVRRELCSRFPASAATDLMSVLDTVRKGCRAISEPRARVRMGDVPHMGDQFERKVRTVLTGLACLPAMLCLLNPLRCGLFSLELFSHKVLRWLGGPLLAILFVSNALLAAHSVFYHRVFLAQVCAYLLALLGFHSPRLLTSSLVVRVPCVFLATNLSTAVAWWKYLSGVRMPIWEPSKRGARGAGT